MTPGMSCHTRTCLLTLMGGSFVPNYTCLEGSDQETVVVSTPSAVSSSSEVLPSCVRMCNPVLCIVVLGQVEKQDTSGNERERERECESET